MTLTSSLILIGQDGPRTSSLQPQPVRCPTEHNPNNVFGRINACKLQQVVAAVLHLLNVEFDTVDIPGQDVGSEVRTGL